MAKNTNQKQDIVNKYVSILNNNIAAYFFSSTLNAAKTQEIKSFLTDDANLTLIKNTLFNRAAKEAGYDLQIDGYNNAIFVKEDMITNASKLNKFLSDNELEVNFILVGKEKYDGNKIKSIAKLGSKEEVYTKLVCTFSSSTTQFVIALNSPLQKLVRVLSQIHSAKASA